MIRYENARTADLPAIAELFQNAFPEALLAVFGKPRLPPQAVIDLFTAVYRFEPGGFIVARGDNHPVGFVAASGHLGHLYRHLIFGGTIPAMIGRWCLGRYKGLGLSFIPRLARLGWDYRQVEKNPAVAGNNIAQMLSIVVDQSVQRQGIGRQLTQLALNYLRQMPAKRVRLEVDAAKPGPIKLYQQFGFKEAARLPTPRGPALVMTLSLK